MATYTTERVLEVTHWSERLFSFKTTRGAGLRFENGQFLMLGLRLTAARSYARTALQAPTIGVSYSIKRSGGPLTSRLQHIERGSTLLMSTEPDRNAGAARSQTRKAIDHARHRHGHRTVRRHRQRPR